MGAVKDVRKTKQSIPTIWREALRLLNGMVHPTWANDPLEAPRHRAFLAVALVTGAVSLILLPLHLALLGPTPLPMVLLVGWMLAQWPLAHYLSQTGRLDRAYGLSSFLFAGFLGAMAFVSGGPASFAVIWLAIVPMEAALSGSKRVVLAAASACVAVVAALFLFAPAGLAIELPGSSLFAASSLAAILYSGGLCTRLVADQARLHAKLVSREGEARLLNQGTDNLVLRCEADGDIQYVGGNLERFLGATKRQLRGNWLFQRVHVADRPAYLQALADARSGEPRKRIEFRLRHGASDPGEAGTADYIWISADLKTAEAVDSSEKDILLCLTNITERKEVDQDHEIARTAIEAELQQKAGLVAAAGIHLRGSAENFVKLSGLLNALPETNRQGGERTRAVVDEMLWTGRKLLQTVDGLEEAAALSGGHRSLEITAVDLHEIIETARGEVAPVATGVGVHLQLDLPQNRVTIPADKAAIQHLLIQSLRAVVDGSRDGDKVSLSLCRGRGYVEMVLQGQHASAEGEPSKAVENDFRFTMVERLCAMQGGITESHVEPNGDCRLLLRLPCAAPVAVSPVDQERHSAPKSLRIA